MWHVETTDRFDKWFKSLDAVDRENVLVSLMLLQDRGPKLSRPYADTIKRSKFVNMKELRIQSKGDPIRAFFAFDPERKGIVLCAGKKVGKDKRFYDEMIPIADNEYSEHLEKLKVK